MTEKIGKN